MKNINSITVTKVPCINFIFSIFMAIYPILCVYKAVSRFTVGDVVLILFFLYSLTNPFKIEKSFFAVLVFIFYAAFSTVVNSSLSYITINYEYSALLFRLIKMVFYFVCVFTTGRQFLDFKIFKKAVLVVFVCASLFLFLQYIFYYAFGEIVLGQMPGLTLYLSEYAEIDYERSFFYNFRPSSLFLEPAIFCQCASVGLVVALFSKNNKITDIISAFIITLAMIMTGSAQGILFIIVIYGIYIFLMFKNKVMTVVLYIFAAVSCRELYVYLAPFKNAVERLLHDEAAAEARLGTYDACFSLHGLHSLFGYGYGVTYNNEYMAGAAYIWYGCGIIGLIMTIGIFYSFFRNADNYVSKMLCLIFFIMFFGTALFYNYMLYWYFALIFGITTTQIEGENQSLGQSVKDSLILDIG